MRRRDLLVAAAGAATMSALAAEQSPTDDNSFAPSRRDVVDVHVHFLPAAYHRALQEAGVRSLDGGMPIPDWSAEQAIAVMDQYGIAVSVLSLSSPGLKVVAPEREPHLARAVNEAAARLRDGHPARFGAFAVLPLSDARASIKEIDYALDVLKLQGFVLLTNDRGRYPSHLDFRDVFGALSERRAVLFLHPTSPVCAGCIDGGRPSPLIEFPFETTRAIVDLLYSGTLEAYPGIRFILAHGGGTLPFLAHRIATFAALPIVSPRPAGPQAAMHQLSRLYYDTALTTSPAQISALRMLVPDTQILFGSDWPFSPARSIAGALAALRANDALSAAGRDAILQGNAHALLAFPGRRF